MKHKKKSILYIKWVAMALWLGGPFVLKAYDLLIISEPFVVPWAGCGVFIAVLVFGRAAFLLTNHLQINYPQDYKKIFEYKTKTYFQRVKGANISKRFDMAYSFSPPNDERYAEIKRIHKNAMLFSMMIGPQRCAFDYNSCNNLTYEKKFRILQLFSFDVFL